jgi:hypothetical protein
VVAAEEIRRIVLSFDSRANFPSPYADRTRSGARGAFVE